MKVTQIYEIVNSLTEQVTGKADLVATDLSNIVDVGKEVFDATSVDNYVRKLVDHIGKVVFVNRPYAGNAPSIQMDGWEYGAVLEKIDCDIPDAEANSTWNLQDGTTYNQDVFHAPVGVTVKFWNKRVTFQVPFSFADDQVKSAFSNATQLNAFFSMIYTKIETSFTIKLDSLIRSTIVNLIAGTLHADYPSDSGYGDSTHVRSINLLLKYNNKFGTTLTAAKALFDLDFLKFAAREMKLASSHLKDPSYQFNVGGKIRHTPQSEQRIILLDQFAESANVYLQSDTFHNEFVKFPTADIISFWQGVGDAGYEFEDVAKIHVNITDPTEDDSSTVEIAVSGILGTIFDKQAAAVNCFNRRVTNHYNGLGEFTNFWYKMDAQYFNDFNENCIVFFIADKTAGGLEARSSKAS